MEQKKHIILDMADTLPGLDGVFVENKTVINNDAITAAMLYLSGVPSYDSPKFGVSENTTVDFYKKFDKLDEVQIRAFLKAVELEGIAKIEEYALPLRKELTKAISAIRVVEKAYNIRLSDFGQ